MCMYMLHRCFSIENIVPSINVYYKWVEYPMELKEVSPSKTLPTDAVSIIH